MLPKIQMVRNALDSLHTSTCTIQLKTKGAIDPTTGIVQADKVTSVEYPCRISFKSSNPSTVPNGLGDAVQTVTLFLAPEIIVPPGSEVVVNQNGRTTAYTASGVPMVFQSHQEIPLKEKVIHHVADRN